MMDLLNMAKVIVNKMLARIEEETLERIDI